MAGKHRAFLLSIDDMMGLYRVDDDAVVVNAFVKGMDAYCPFHRTVLHAVLAFFPMWKRVEGDDAVAAAVGIAPVSHIPPLADVVQDELLVGFETSETMEVDSKELEIALGTSHLLQHTELLDFVQAVKDNKDGDAQSHL